MAQIELEQIAMAMMMMAEDPERRRQQVLQRPMSATVDVLSPRECENKDAPNNYTGSSISSVEDNLQKEEEEESDYVGEEPLLAERNGDTEELDNNVGINNNYSINPNSLSTPSPSSPAGSLKSNGSSSTGTGLGGGGGANSSTRRIFTPEFKQRVLDAFNNDPECVGNQRAISRKFNIHRRQVQKWLQQLSGQSSISCLPANKDQPSSDEQEQKVKKSDNDLVVTPNPPSTSVPLPILPRNKINPNRSKSRSNRSRAKMPILAGKGPSIQQASTVSSSPSASLPSSSPFMGLGKGVGNAHHPLFSNNNSNLFMGLASPLLSSLPLALEACNSRHLSPPGHSPPNGVGHINGHSPPNGNLSINAQRMLELVDELCYLYPSEDFSLLRNAMLKNEVSFTKLSPPLRRHNSNNARKNSSSPSSSNGNDYITQQTLQMIKNQNEYLQLLQSGYANLSQFQDVPNISDPSNGKYASWLHPFAAAAVAGYNLQGNNKIGNGLDANNGNRKRGNNGNSESSSHHNFAPPKAPVSNPKSKTVAAVLAQARNGPSTPQRMQNSLPYDKTKRSTQNRRKNGRPMKSFPSTTNNDDDYLDPTSMLEVVTSKPSPMDNMDSYGMDLSTTNHSSVIQKSPSSTIRSKAMNKDYGFLSELGLVRKEHENNLDREFIKKSIFTEIPY